MVLKISTIHYTLVLDLVWHFGRLLQVAVQHGTNSKLIFYRCFYSVTQHITVRYSKVFIIITDLKHYL